MQGRAPCAAARIFPVVAHEKIGGRVAAERPPSLVLEGFLCRPGAGTEAPPAINVSASNAVRPPSAAKRQYISYLDGNDEAARGAGPVLVHQLLRHGRERSDDAGVGGHNDDAPLVIAQSQLARHRTTVKKPPSG